MAVKRKSTMVELVTELEKLIPRCTLVVGMIQEAKDGEYHDFKNQKYTCGKVAASTMLESIGHHPLANRIKNGEFDEIPDLEDKKQMREDAIEGGMTAAQCKAFGL